MKRNNKESSYRTYIPFLSMINTLFVVMMHRSRPALNAASTVSSGCNRAGDERSFWVNSLGSFWWASFKKPRNFDTTPDDVGPCVADAPESAEPPSAFPMMKQEIKVWMAKISAFPLRKSWLTLLFQNPLNHTRIFERESQLLVGLLS